MDKLAVQNKITIAPTILSIYEQNIVKASLGVKIKDLPNDFHAELILLIAKVYADKGQIAEPTQIKSLALSLCNELKAYFKGITLEEVKIALESGIRGEYGEYFGINIISFNQFIKGYISDSRTKSAKDKQEQYYTELKEKELELEKTDWTQQFVIHIYDKWKESKIVDCVNGTCFNWLKANGFDNVGTDFKNQALKQAEEQFYNKSKEEKESAIVRFQGLAYELSKPKKTSKEIEAENKIKNAAKRICVDKIFQSIDESKLKANKL